MTLGDERGHHLEAVNRAAEERIAALTAIVNMLERARYGRHSERLGGAVLDDDQYVFVSLGVVFSPKVGSPALSVQHS